MARITVSSTGQHAYQVIVEEDDSRTVHQVTVTADDIARYAPGGAAAQLLEASFEFLLERESKESILSSFSLPVIERYFPDYPTTIRERLSR